MPYDAHKRLVGALCVDHSLKRILTEDAIGLHNESLWTGISEFDREIQRRLWCALTLWDRFMGMMLARPLLINDRFCTAQAPSANLEHDPAFPGVSSPFKHMELQRLLIKDTIQIFDGSKEQLTVDEARSIITIVKAWFDKLPPIYRATNPDRTFDKTHPYLVLQRLQTICMGYSTIISPLKSFLTRTYAPDRKLDLATLSELQLVCIDTCLRRMEIAQQLADLFIPDYNKYFLIVFTPFDTAALLASAILHDIERTLPQRMDLLHAIAQGLTLVRRLKAVTKTGYVAESVLTSLISKFHLTSSESDIFSDFRTTEERPSKRLATSPRSNAAGSSCTLPETNASRNLPSRDSDPGPGDSFSTSSISTESVRSDKSPPLKVNEESPLDETLCPLELEQLLDFDFGSLEPVFDWSDINLFDLEPPAFNFDGGL